MRIKISYFKLSSILIALLLVVAASCHDSNSPTDSTPPEDDLDAYVSIAGSNLMSMFPDPVRSYLYISDGSQNCVHFFNTMTNVVEYSLAIGSSPTLMDISEDNSLLFVVLSGAAQIGIINLTNRLALTPIDVPDWPVNSVAVGKNDRLYLGMGQPQKSPSIHIFDVSATGPNHLGTLEDSTTLDLGHIAGRSQDRKFLYTQQYLYNTPKVIQWDISEDKPVELHDFYLFGKNTTDAGTIFSLPGDESIFILGTGSANDDGVVPVHRKSDLLRTGQFVLEWAPIAVASNLMGDRIYIAHGLSVTNITYPFDLRHDKERKDLHIFDTETFAEIGYFTLREYAKKNGVVVAANNRIYILLGQDDGKIESIGVIAP